MMLPADAKTVPDGWKAALLAIQNDTPFIFGTPSPVLDDDFNDPVTGLDGWSQLEPTGIVTLENGSVKLENGAAVAANISKAITVEANTDYLFGVDNTSALSDGLVYIGTAPGLGDIMFEQGPNVPANTPGLLFSFNSGVNTTLYVQLQVNSLGVGDNVSYDNVKVQQARLQNSTFDSDLTGWTPGVGWSWADGRAVHAAGADSELSQTAPFAEGDPVRVEVSVSDISGGSLVINCGGGVTLGTITSPGVYVFNGNCGTVIAPLARAFASSGVTCGIDYFIVSLQTPLTEANYDRSDWWFAYLGSIGYTGSMNDRELAYWLDLFEATTGTAFNAAFSNGFG